VRRLHWRGEHWALRIWPRPYANVPLRGPHRILVIGWGRCDRRGRFRQNQPCAYPMTLHHCCGRGD
jgi:hypothetical protein